MNSKRLLVIVAVAISAALATRAATAEDKYALKIPDGLAFSEFRG